MTFVIDTKAHRVILASETDFRIEGRLSENAGTVEIDDLPNLFKCFLAKTRNADRLSYEERWINLQDDATDLALCAYALAVKLQSPSLQWRDYPNWERLPFLWENFVNDDVLEFLKAIQNDEIAFSKTVQDPDSKHPRDLSSLNSQFLALTLSAECVRSNYTLRQSTGWFVDCLVHEDRFAKRR